MWDLDQMIPQRPTRKKNGQWAKGHIPFNKGRKWSEWMDGRKQNKVRKCLDHSGNPKIGGWNRKPIAAVKDGKVVFFESSKDAQRKTGIEARNIRSVCSKKRKHAGGCQWFYTDDTALKAYL